jgi:crossover junction endodeoxyribonuclease RuvC
MIVLGVDPGVWATGYGVVDDGRDGGGPILIECGTIRPRSRKPLAERLLEIFEGLGQVIERSRPDVVCVEGVFYGRNARTTVVLGHARGAALLAAAARGVPVFEYPPAEIKSAVAGSGSARKGQVAFMVQKHLSLAEPPQPSDAADGVAVALCHLLRERLTRGGARAGGVGRNLP